MRGVAHKDTQSAAVLVQVWNLPTSSWLVFSQIKFQEGEINQVLFGSYSKIAGWCLPEQTMKNINLVLLGPGTRAPLVEFMVFWLWTFIKPIS